MRNKGFTLIELLVTISLLGVLSGVAITLIDPAAQIARAKDNSIKAEINQIAGAMEAYGAENNGRYVIGVTTAPANPGTLTAPNEGCAGTAGVCPGGIIENAGWDELLVASKIVKNVKNQNIVYDSNGNGSRFRLYALMNATKIEGAKGQLDTMNSPTCDPGTYVYGNNAEVYYVYDSLLQLTYWWCTSAGPVWPRPSL